MLDQSLEQGENRPSRPAGKYNSRGQPGDRGPSRLAGEAGKQGEPRQRGQRSSPERSVASGYSIPCQISTWIFWVTVGWWGCEASCGGHHRQRRKTTTNSALDGAVLDFTEILAYLVHNMSRTQLYLVFGHFGRLHFLANNILGLWLNCISSVEITIFLLMYYCSIGPCFSLRV